MSVRYGSVVLELSKGKSVADLASPEDLIKRLETARSAVEAGRIGRADRGSQRGSGVRLTKFSVQHRDG